MHSFRQFPECVSKAYSNAELGLTDGSQQHSLDALARIASYALNAPCAFISIVEEELDRQVFTSHHGLPEAWSGIGQTPLSHSFCRHVKQNNEALVVSDARSHPLVKDNPAIEALDIMSYLGMPIHGRDGAPVGAICVVRPDSRNWSATDLAILADIAVCVSNEITLRAALLDTKALHAALESHHAKSQRHNALRESIALNFMAPDLSTGQRFDALLRSGREALQTDHAAIYRIDSDRAKLLFANSADRERSVPRTARVDGTLTELVLRGQSLFHFNDRNVRAGVLRPDLTGRHPRSFISGPLVLNGTLFGVIEFSGTSPRAAAWSDEEQTIVSMISIFASASLEIFGLTGALENGETAMLAEARAVRERISAARSAMVQPPAEIAESTLAQDRAPL